MGLIWPTEGASATVTADGLDSWNLGFGLLEVYVNICIDGTTYAFSR